LICEGRSHERRQKLVENDPLIVPSQLPGGLVKDLTAGYSGQPSLIDERIMCFQHGEMQLRDEHVRVIARVAYDGGTLCVPLYVSPVQSKQELRRIVALVEEWMAGRSVSVQRFEVEFRTPSIV
jgi:hypothetical protein